MKIVFNENIKHTKTCLLFATNDRNFYYFILYSEWN